MSSRRGGWGKDRVDNVWDAQGGRGDREDQQKPFGDDEIIDGSNERFKKNAARQDVWQAFGTHFAERAALNI